MTDKVALEVAEQEFDRFVELMDISIKEDDSEEQILLKNMIVSAISKGSVIINESGEPLFTPQRSENKEQLHFHEPTGHALVSSSKQQQSDRQLYLYNAMAEMTKTSVSRFSNMKVSDLKICMAIGGLFLA